MTLIWFGYIAALRGGGGQHPVIRISCADGRRRMDEVNGNGKRLPKLREILRRQKQDSEV
jgi:hypothetical protein